MKSSFWSKKMMDMTVGDTLKFTGIVTVSSVALGLAIGYWDDISYWFYDKFKRKVTPALSTEEEDDWGV